MVAWYDHMIYIKRGVYKIYIHIVDPGNSSNNTQHISRPFTPEKRPIQHSPHVQLLREDLKNKENNKEIIK